MNFGEKIKLLRLEKNLNQPELAERIGIEQPYLSKLETGKAFPSNEIFDQILAAFSISTDELLKDVGAKEINRNLRTIPAVAAHLSEHQSKTTRTRKWWLLSSAAAIVCGLTFITAGQLNLAFPTVQWQYQSTEIVPKGANGEVFFTLDEYVEYAAAPIGREILANDELSTIERNTETQRSKSVFYLELANLRFTEFRITDQGGQFFTQELDSDQDQQILNASGIRHGATRTFERLTQVQQRNSDFRVFFTLGGFLLFAGIFGFVIERQVLSNVSE